MPVEKSHPDGRLLMLGRGDAEARYGRIAPFKIEIKRFLAADVQVQAGRLHGPIHRRGKDTFRSVLSRVIFPEDRGFVHAGDRFFDGRPRHGRICPGQLRLVDLLHIC